MTSAANTGKTEEKQQSRQHLEPERCYVMDRWFAEFCLGNAIVAAGSSYVCRIEELTAHLEKLRQEEKPREAETKPRTIPTELVASRCAQPASQLPIAGTTRTASLEEISSASPKSLPAIPELNRRGDIHPFSTNVPFAIIGATRRLLNFF
jgi:hypothetical protein